MFVSKKKKSESERGERREGEKRGERGEAMEKVLFFYLFYFTQDTKTCSIQDRKDKWASKKRFVFVNMYTCVSEKQERAKNNKRAVKEQEKKGEEGCKESERQVGRIKREKRREASPPPRFF